ncbi:MAG: hypothetical protein AABW85_05040 [archaeon]
MKACFFIKAKEPNIITEKGVRAFVMERLLNSSFDKGSVANLDDKTIQVQMEGDEKEVRKFKEQLEKDVIAKFGNPIITFSDIQKTTNDIPNLLKSSQALMVGQLQKDIDVQLKILDSLNILPEKLKEMNQELKEELKSIPRELAKILKK